MVSKDYDQIVLQNIIIHISNQKVKFPGILFAINYIEFSGLLIESCILLWRQNSVSKITIAAYIEILLVLGTLIETVYMNYKINSSRH